MADAMNDTPEATLTRRRRYTIDVPRLGPVTYSRGETVPPRHFQHVPGRDRRWFDTPEGDDRSPSAESSEEDESAE